MVREAGRPFGQGNLLLPNESVLIVVDHQTAFARCFDRDTLLAARNGVSELLAAAKSLDVPVIASLIETNRIGADLGEGLSGLVEPTACIIRSQPNPWDEPAFVDKIRSFNRARLILAGLSIETSLSYTALCALEEGYDVYAVSDVCLGQSEASHRLALERLTQAGVVAIGWRQVVLEWQRQNLDARKLKRLLRRQEPVTP